MRVAHFDCFSGACGDMLLGALIDAGVDEAAIRAALDSLGLPIALTTERVKRSERPREGPRCRVTRLGQAVPDHAGVPIENAVVGE